MLHTALVIMVPKFWNGAWWGREQQEWEREKALLTGVEAIRNQKQHGDVTEGGMDEELENSHVLLTEAGESSYLHVGF